MKWFHKASGPKKMGAIAACGICAYYTGKGLGELFQHSTDKLLYLLTPVFARHHLGIESLKHNCIKLFLKFRATEELQQWLAEVEDYTFHKEVCTAMEEASDKFEEFKNLKVSFIPEHFHFVVSSLSGKEINSKTLREHEHRLTEKVYHVRLIVFYDFNIWSTWWDHCTLTLNRPGGGGAESAKRLVLPSAVLKR